MKVYLMLENGIMVEADSRWAKVIENEDGQLILLNQITGRRDVLSSSHTKKELEVLLDNNS